MGGGASLDNSRGSQTRQRPVALSPGRGVRFYCHECHHTDRRPSAPEQCPFCQSSFVEELTPPPLFGLEGGQDEGSLGAVRRRHFDLNEDQARRLNSAAALLHLLEAQLREELDTLNSQTTALILGGGGLGGEKAPAAPLTQGMRDSLKDVVTTVPMICEQPSCPVCSEDYEEKESVTELPCGHLFHAACVLPWLEAKRTCPICRDQLKHTVHSCQELEALGEEELRVRLQQRGLSEDSSISELAKSLHLCLVREEEEEQQQQQQQQTSVLSDSSRMLVFPTLLPRGTADMPENSGRPRLGGFDVTSAMGRPGLSSVLHRRRGGEGGSERRNISSSSRNMRESVRGSGSPVATLLTEPSSVLLPSSMDDIDEGVAPRPDMLNS